MQPAENPLTYLPLPRLDSFITGFAGHATTLLCTGCAAPLFLLLRRFGAPRWSPGSVPLPPRVHRKPPDYLELHFCTVSPSVSPLPFHFMSTRPTTAVVPVCVHRCFTVQHGLVFRFPLLIYIYIHPPLRCYTYSSTNKHQNLKPKTNNN